MVKKHYPGRMAFDLSGPSGRRPGKHPLARQWDQATGTLFPQLIQFTKTMTEDPIMASSPVCRRNNMLLYPPNQQR